MRIVLNSCSPDASDTEIIADSDPNMLELALSGIGALQHDSPDKIPLRVVTVGTAAGAALGAGLTLPYAQSERLYVQSCT